MTVPVSGDFVTHALGATALGCMSSPFAAFLRTQSSVDDEPFHWPDDPVVSFEGPCAEYVCGRTHDVRQIAKNFRIPVEMVEYMESKEFAEAIAQRVFRDLKEAVERSFLRGMWDMTPSPTPPAGMFKTSAQGTAQGSF